MRPDIGGAELRRKRRPLAVLWLALLPLVAGLGALAAPRDVPSGEGVRLIMVEEVACRFCRQWSAEIEPGYGKTAEGRFAPLTRVLRGDPEVRNLAPITYTPTFIVMQGSDELGRITGYPGADYFYVELRVILAAAGFFPGL
ncbi:thioredoxin [Hyphomicrobium sp.]|uniref:thioredoxin n=1 Tax=Hyphomicrobium sp. TaxID=82 RepID=UPI0025BD47D7|nr:thioredoxin [Hyphomicrobium sp.]MCC7252014.1 thioredoxin [Hyphomicrobium sp.]